MAVHETVSAQIQGLKMVERHITSEYTNDVPTIMGTISASPRYALVSGQHGSPVLTALNDRAEVASYYSWTHEQHHEPISTRHPKQIVTDWYVFCEALPSQRPVGQSEVVLTNYALMFPFEADGMVGEIMWKRNVFSEPGTYADVDITVTAPFAAGDVRSLRLFEAMAAAVDDGSADTLKAVIAEDCQAAVPSLDDTEGRLQVLHGGGDVIAWYMRLSNEADIVESVSLNTVATSWYIFDERFMSLRLQRDGLFNLAKGSEAAVRFATLYKLGEDGDQIDGVATIAKVHV